MVKVIADVRYVVAALMLALVPAIALAQSTGRSAPTDPGAAGDFYRYIRKFWPGLPDGSLSPDYAGVRPKLHGPDEAQPDFRLDGPDAHGLPGLVALFGIESPGLTSSLAIGEEVATRLGL